MYHHSLGLKADGSLVAWGRNDWGQCNVPSPNEGFALIATGTSHSLGLKNPPDSVGPDSRLNLAGLMVAVTHDPLPTSPILFVRVLLQELLDLHVQGRCEQFLRPGSEDLRQHVRGTPLWTRGPQSGLSFP